MEGVFLLRGFFFAKQPQVFPSPAQSNLPGIFITPLPNALPGVLLRLSHPGQGWGQGLFPLGAPPGVRIKILSCMHDRMRDVYF